MKFLQLFILISLLTSTIVLAEDEENEGNGEDICYTDIYTESMRLPSICMGFGGINCRNVIPIVNSSGEDISNVKVYLTSDGIMNASFNDDCGVKDDQGTCTNDSDNQTNSHDVRVGNTTIFGYSYGYDLNTMTVDDQKDTYIESAVSINFNNKKLYTTYTKDGVDYYSEVYSCGATGSSAYLTGPFDAWDTDSNITDRVIQTKIVSSTFNLKINSMNADNSDTETKTGIDIKYRLYDLNTTTAVTDWETYDASLNSDGESEIKSFTVLNSSYRDVRVQFALCYMEKYGITYKPSTELQPLSNCEEDELDTSTFSTDNFAIRPYAFRVFGGDAYSRAGEEFTVDIKAVDFASYNLNSGTSNDVIGTAKYNVVFSDISLSSNFYTPTDTELDIMYKNVMQDSTATASTADEIAKVATCSSPGIFTKINATASFINGNFTAELKFSETGILTINVNENEIIGHEFAIVDTDDTPLDQRLILGSSKINSRSDINNTSLLLVNPYSIDTSAEYNSSTNKQWIYMNDISSAATTYTKPTMSSYIHYTVTAKNKDGVTTKNFNSTCFPDVTESWPDPLATDCPRVNGLKLNTTYDFKLTATIDTTADVNLSIYNGDVDENALYIDTLDQDANLSKSSTNTLTKATMYPKQFTNGTAESYVHFNIDRNTSVVRNPVTIKVIDVNTWLGWSSSASPAAFNGTILNKSYNFVYGRTHAPRQKFSTNPGEIFIYYETYCSNVDSFNNTCNKNLLPDAVDSHTTDDPRWFVNTKHFSTAGSIGLVTQKNGTTNVTASIPSGGSPATVNLTYNSATAKGYPYKTTMQNHASTWLIYNKYNDLADSNEFDVEFLNPNANWSGIQETSTTTQTNATEQTNRRTMW